MGIKKRYTFLYTPEDHGASRRFQVPRWSILAVGAVAVVLVTGSVLYGVDVHQGGAWVPGGSRLARANERLHVALAGLERRVTGLQVALDDTRKVQREVAAAVNLPMADDETYAAGVGGRGGLLAGPAEVTGIPAAGWAGSAAPDLGQRLDLLVRQARIQRQGYQAMLDTLAVRESVRQRIPSIRPLRTGWLSSRFGFRDDPFTGRQTFHRGLDFSTPVGTPVRVTGDGTVTAVQTQRGFGRVVKIDHGGGVTTVYAHLDHILVDKGSEVRRGDVIARSGNSGRSSAPHLHYEVRIGDRPVNPLSYILDSYAQRP